MYTSYPALPQPYYQQPTTPFNNFGYLPPMYQQQTIQQFFNNCQAYINMNNVSAPNQHHFQQQQ